MKPKTDSTMSETATRSHGTLLHGTLGASCDLESSPSLRHKSKAKIRKRTKSPASLSFSLFFSTLLLNEHLRIKRLPFPNRRGERSPQDASNSIIKKYRSSIPLYILAIPPPTCITSASARWSPPETLLRVVGPDGVAIRPRLLLRRLRAPRHRRRCLWIWGSGEERVRDGDGGAERGFVRQGGRMRGLLRGAVRGGAAVLPPGDVHRGHGDQLLRSQLRPSLRRRRDLQPPQPSLPHAHRGLREDRHLEGRRYAHPISPGQVHQARRYPVHDGGPRFLHQRADQQCGRCRRRDGGEGEGDDDWGLAVHGPELGPELAHQRRPQWAGPLLRAHHQRRRHSHLLQRRPQGLGVWPDVYRQAIPFLIIITKPAFILTKSFVAATICVFLSCKIVSMKDGN